MKKLSLTTRLSIWSATCIAVGTTGRLIIDNNAGYENQNQGVREINYSTPERPSIDSPPIRDNYAEWFFTLAGLAALAPPALAFLGSTVYLAAVSNPASNSKS